MLWPLFHYLPGEVDYDPGKWEGYQQANAKFCEAIVAIAQPHDLIWIHDYHLMLLPAMLRKAIGSQVKLGWFLHTPFPASEIYRGLPQRKEILQGLLACDLVGFHTHDYARHFKSACQRLLPVRLDDCLLYEGQTVKVGTFPVGIDPVPWEEATVKVDEIPLSRGKQMLLGVDRLDYIKGVPHKLHAFERLLEQYPEHRGQAILLQVKTNLLKG